MPPDTPSDNPPGDYETRILHYRVLRPLGSGGMGEVLLAEDERLGRKVALKFLPRFEASDPERRERLRREARSLAALAHPGIAGIFALEEVEGRLFLVMEFVEGETLADRIARRPLPVPEVIERGRVLAEALAHAHARGVVHRDVKPTNVLVTPEGATKLADFGLALLEGETRLTAEGTSAGTADYMSPEQTQGAPLDRRSDLFSLGVVLYQALTGVRPFSRSSLEATFDAIRREEPEAPTALRTGIPLELERIILKCLRKDPAERYQHAEDLAADLRALHSGAGRAETAAAIPRPPVAAGSAPGARPKRRIPRAALVSLGVLLLLAMAYLLNGLRTRRGGEAEAAQRTIAVLSFQHLADPDDPRREAVMAASLLTVGLGQSQVIPVVSAQRVHDVLHQMGKSDRAVSGTDALDVGRRAGATYVVTGYIYQTQPEVVLGAEVASTANGAVLTSCRVKAAGGDQGMFAAVDSLTAALRDGLARAGFGVRETAVDVAGLTTRNPVAYRAYARGLDFLYRGDWEKAAQGFQEAVAADSTFAQAWYHLAVATWWDADFPGAEHDVKSGLRLGNRLTPRDRSGLRALSSLIVRNWPEAAKRYRELIARYPEDKEFQYGLGEALFHGGRDLEGARAALEKALEVDPTFAVPYIHLIDLAVMREDLGGALALTDRLHRADPTNPTWLAHRMFALGWLGDPEGAKNAARRYLALSRDNPFVIRKLATLNTMSGEFDSLQTIIEMLNRSDRAEDRQATRIAGTFLAIAKGRYREGERLGARDMGGLKPERSEAYLALVTMRSRALVELGRYDEAIALLHPATHLPPQPHSGPPSGAGLEEEIQALVRAGRVADAEKILREYDQILRSNPDSHHEVDRDAAAGLIAMAKNRPQEAVRLLMKPVGYAPSENGKNQRRWVLARALLATGQADRGIEELEKVVTRMPFGGTPVETFKAMLLLAQQYEKRGRRDEALALYRRIAYQYRFAEPGLRVNEEAKAGIARLERQGAQATAD